MVRRSIVWTRTADLGYFNIFYKTTNSQILVLAFWDNRQNPKELLSYLDMIDT